MGSTIKQTNNAPRQTGMLAAERKYGTDFIPAAVGEQLGELSARQLQPQYYVQAKQKLASLSRFDGVGLCISSSWAAAEPVGHRFLDPLRSDSVQTSPPP